MSDTALHNLRQRYHDKVLPLELGYLYNNNFLIRILVIGVILFIVNGVVQCY